MRRSFWIVRGSRNPEATAPGHFADAKIGVAPLSRVSYNPLMSFLNGNNKRRFYRHPHYAPIQYRTLDRGIPSSATAVDVSQGGICFLADRFFPTGSELSVAIPVSGQVFQMRGRVAYCTHVPNVNRYRTGVAFSDALSAFKAKLAEQIHLIQEYRRERALKDGVELTEEEAARAWIEKYAKKFASLF